jgi:nicotinamidase/pyrazinamidase
VLEVRLGHRELVLIDEERLIPGGWHWHLRSYCHFRFMDSRIDPATDALLIIDVQHDFLPGGALQVPEGDDVLPFLRPLAARFGTVVATQDFHPPGHVSFASAHPGRGVLETVLVNGQPQMLWPDHCVAGSAGAALSPAVPDERLSLILRKGTRRDVDSYSAFREQSGPDGFRRSTGLGGWLRARGIERVVVAGLARDYCVAATAIDAAGEEFRAVVLDDATRAIAPDRRAETDEAFRRSGVRIGSAGELLAF